jgi:hypothetical protein
VASGWSRAAGRFAAGRNTVVSESEVFAMADGQELLIAKLSSTLTVLDERPFASPVPAMARPDDDPNGA